MERPSALALIAALALCAASVGCASPPPSVPTDSPRVDVPLVDDAHDIPAAGDDRLPQGDASADDTADVFEASDAPPDLTTDDAHDSTVSDTPDTALADAVDVSDAPPAVDTHDAGDITDHPDVSVPADAPRDASRDVPTDAPACLRAITTDLVAYLDRAPYATRTGTARMTVYPMTSTAWQAARRAAVAWSRGDCAGFASAARDMGYDAVEVTDSVTRRRHWVLIESTGRHYNGVFAFVAPYDMARTRPLVIDSPHRGFDFSDDRAIRAYRDTAAVAFLENTAHRCNSDVCSGCSPISNYACGGCVVESDVVHSTGTLFYAVYDGLESARDDLHFEYHGAAMSNNIGSCAGSVHLSQASSRPLTATADDGTYANRLWRALERSLGAGCVCYHQRESGCLLNGGGSTAGRRTNQEAGGPTVNVCTTSPGALAGRFAHFEAYNVPVARAVEALNEAVPTSP